LTYYRPLVDVDGVEVRLHATTLYASLFRYDDEILVNPHAFGEPASANPIVAYTDGEIRQAYEVMLTARPMSGSPAVNDEASDVRWVEPADLDALDIHETQWRQLRDYLSGTYPHVD
jgi:hypothetical protein